MTKASDLKIKIFLDGANAEDMLNHYANPLVKGFTTNPSLMRQAGIDDYEAFARGMLEKIPDRPISFEDFADEFDEMERQALKITEWGENVYVKIPVTNTKTESAAPLIRRLAGKGVKMNITALMTADQVRDVVAVLDDSPSCFISVFAGRHSDRGHDPIPVMKESLEIVSPHPALELLWASTREAFNIVEADRLGCHIITAPGAMIGKLSGFGGDMIAHSLETVQIFYDDASTCGYKI